MAHTISPTSPGLNDTTPWSIDSPCTLLVYDKIESDGRFVGYHLALQALRNGNRVLWLQGGPVTESLVQRSLKKLGWDPLIKKDQQVTPASSCVTGSFDDSFQVRCLTVELANKLLTTNDAGDETAGATNVVIYFKNLFRAIEEWVQAGSSPAPWIIVDDLSSLAAISGDILAYKFVASLQSMSVRSTCGIYIRCAGDCSDSFIDSSHGFLAAGGAINRGNDDGIAPSSWEDSLVEMADYIVDVLPLPGGSTRDIHGRLIFTELATHKTIRSSVVNYSLHENKVTTVRVRR